MGLLLLELYARHRQGYALFKLALAARPTLSPLSIVPSTTPVPRATPAGGVDGAPGPILDALSGPPLIWMRLPSAPPGAPPNPNFHPGDIRRVFNRHSYENRRAFFEHWPAELDLFDPASFFGVPLPTDEDLWRPTYLFKPNFRLTLKNGQLAPARAGDEIAWASNPWGFRGRPFPIAKPAGTLRIVCLGGSTTEGEQGEETYPFMLEQELMRELPGRSVEVINAGHSGLNSHDLLMILRFRVFPLQPDIVIYYEVGNGINEWEFFNIVDSDPRSRFPANRGRFVSALYWQYQLDRYSATYRAFAEGLHWGFPAKAYTFDERKTYPSLRWYVQGVRRIVEECQPRGVKVLMGSAVTGYREGMWSEERVPSNLTWLYKRWYPVRPADVDVWYRVTSTHLRQVAREQHVPFVELAAEFPKEDRLFAGYGGPVFDPSHYSPEGNRLLARLFARALLEEVVSR